MDDQLDNDLKNRIKEVFDNFEDTSADEGWLELRKKFPEEKSDRRVFAWIWWGATAALVLLFLGIGLWVYTKKQASPQFAQHQIKQNINNGIASKPAAHDTINQTIQVKPAQIATTLSPHLTDKNTGNSERGLSQSRSNHKLIGAAETSLNDSINQVPQIADKAGKKVIIPNKAPDNQLAVAKQNNTNVVITPPANTVAGINNNQQQPVKGIVNGVPAQQSILASTKKAPATDVIVPTDEVAKTKPKVVNTPPTVATPVANVQQEAARVAVTKALNEQLVTKTKPKVVNTPPTVVTPNVNPPQQVARVAVTKTPDGQLVAKTKLKVVNIPPTIVAPNVNPPQQASRVAVTKAPGEQLVAKTTPIVPATGNTPSNKVPANTPATTAVVNNQQHKKTINDMFAEDEANMQKKDEVSDKDDKKIRFGVYAATYFNYAKGSNNQINAGAGFTSDIAISKNLKLVTGLAINQNTLSYAGTTPTASSQNDLILVAAQANYGNVSANVITGANNLGAANLNPSPGYSSSFISLKNYNASLIGLDIPVNLKYEFNQVKHNLYVLAGVSSGTFINESYTYQYNYPSVTSAATQQAQSETTTKNFNSFYFAKTLNLGFGVGYALGKNNMVIEPFLKYPLQGLGAQQIRFGAGGINLKFNFSSKK